MKQREMTESIVKDYDVSLSRACKLTSLPRSGYYYQSRKDDLEVITLLQDLALKHPSHGFRKLLAYIYAEHANTGIISGYINS